MNKGKLNAMIQKVSQNTGIVYNSVLMTEKRGSKNERKPKHRMERVLA